MQNKLPVQLDGLFTLAEDMAVGCQNHETSIGLMQNKEANLRADLDAARTADTAYQAARTARLTASHTLRGMDKAAARVLVTTRDVLKRYLGTSWSQMWAEAGFASGSLAIPDSLAERLALIMSLKTYLTAHPTYEVPSMAVSVIQLDLQYTTVSTLRAAVNACRADVGTKKEVREAAVESLRKRLRGLITELTQLLPGDDARWRAFGLNPPDAVGLPDVPKGLVVVGGGTGHLLATWNSAALAARYRVFKKVLGVDNEFVLGATVTDTQSNLNTFTAGQVVRVRVTAVNDAGESLPSDSVEQTVP